MSYKAIFLDRDDTLIEDPGYINHPGQVHLLPGTSEALIELKRMGYKLVIVTNQSAIARGIVNEETLEQIHVQLRKLLGFEGASIDEIYYCPFHPNGIIPKYRKDSELRKPNPGMILLAADEMDIDTEHSWMLGNSYRDIAAGMRAGCKTILITSAARPAQKKPTDPIPFKKAVNLREAVNIIKMFDRQNPEDQEHIEHAEDHELDEMEHEPENLMQPAEEEYEAEPETPRLNTYEQDSLMTDDDPHGHTESPLDETVFTSDIDKTHRLLEEILRHLKSVHRQTLFTEFSLFKVLAGTAQIIVPFCLLISIWFLIDPNKPASSVHTMIGYAAVFQLMVIAFNLMRDRK